MNRLMLGLQRPVGSIIQYAYTVDDIETSMAVYTEQFGVGPWFRWGPFSPSAAIYRGEPQPSLTITLARAFAGDTMIELIQQHDDGPSVYREVFERRGHGFHHWAIGSDDIESDISRFAGRGYPVVFEDRVPSGARVVYVDSTKDLPGMIEMVEMNEEQELKYQAFHAEAMDWDGRDPVRVG